MATHFFTVFDRNYAARGLVMLASLRSVDRNCRVTVFALDMDSWRMSCGIADEVLRIENLPDSEFLAVKATRSHEEFCWTCAPVISDYMVRQAKPGDLVVYLDADLYFFSSPGVLLAEMGNVKNIMIHPHRFTTDRAAWEKTAGQFNVGFVAFRVSDEARACTARWRRQVLELCVKDPEKGLCGDQAYLNEWPSLYAGLQVMQNIGGGTAPWNVGGYEVSRSASGPTVDGVAIVFFHFHQLRIVDCEQHRFLGAICATGYDFAQPVVELIYDGYLKKLKRHALRLDRLGIELRSDLVCDVREFRHYVGARHVQPVLENHLAKLTFWLIEFFDARAEKRGRFSGRKARSTGS